MASSPFPGGLERTARVFRALGDATRLDILTRLVGGEECVCNLTDALETGQSRLSFHLKTLKDAGLVRDRREGRWVYYSLDRDAIHEVEGLLASLREDRRLLRVVERCCT
jgi:ArsR family transcriptional regulator